MLDIVFQEKWLNEDNFSVTLQEMINQGMNQNDCSSIDSLFRLVWSPKNKHLIYLIRKGSKQVSLFQAASHTYFT